MQNEKYFLPLHHTTTTKQTDMKNSNILNETFSNTHKVFDFMIKNNDVVKEAFNMMLNSDEEMKKEFYAMSKEDQVMNYKMIATHLAFSVGLEIALQK